jgi:hypothetical protein
VPTTVPAESVIGANLSPEMLQKAKIIP